MVNAIHFANYRNFADFHMDGLQRVNLIVGNSNVGKTGLLEGLVILWGNEEQYQALPNTFRMSIGGKNTEKDNYWSWLFPEKNLNTQIVLKSEMEGHDGVEVVLSGRMFSNASYPLRIGQVFNHDRTASHGINYVSHIKLAVLPVGMGDYQSQVNQFNELAQKNKGKEQLIDALRIIEPRLQGLEYLKLPNSEHAMVYADIGLEYKVPTTQFGHGFTRSMETLTHLILSGSEIMIADEIENGIHYSALEPVWTAIINYAVKNNTQVFATTHSRECIAAAHQAMLKQATYELNVIRLQNEDGQVVAINHNQDDIETALDLGLGLR